MPFTDGVSTMSGRNSRASDVSRVTGPPRSIRSPPPAVTASDTLNSAGVMSMLKTSTDTGDIGALSFNKTRLPTIPRPAHQKRGHGARPSGSSHNLTNGSISHNYAPSSISRVTSNGREWDSASNGRRGSLTSMHSMPPYVPDTQEPTQISIMKGAPYNMPGRGTGPDGRSYSMTNMQATSGLPRHRSQTSLKSQGHEPMSRSRGPVPPMPENRPPYAYPSRLKRPGYRSPSPALSDFSQGPPPSGLPGHMARGPPLPRPPPQTYHSDYGTEYGHHDARMLHARPPPRGMSNSPVGYEQQPPYGYRPAVPRIPAGMPMHVPPMQHPAYRHHPPPPPAGAYYAPNYHGQRVPYHPMQPPTHRRYPPPANAQHQPNPAALSLFHSAARLARHLPQRTGTPMTDSCPSSSEPPSSGSAPPSSSPPTPQDQTNVQVVIDPAFIDPALTDLPDSTSAPVLPAQYFEYAEGIVKGIDEPENEGPHASIPPSGFVQRVKAMLESRTAAEAAAKNEAEHEEQEQQLPLFVPTPEPTPEPERQVVLHEEIHELAADTTPRGTVIEEQIGPVELPASPVKIAELDGASVDSNRPLTRAMVKAELAPSSADNTQTISVQLDIRDATRDSVEIEEKPKPETAGEEGTAAIEEHPGSRENDANDKASMPAHAQEHNIQDSMLSEGTSMSEPVSRFSGADYALRFSMPIDTTALDETHSNDPFALDADTMTAKHQEKQPAATPQPNKRASIDPVSPLQPDENVSRCSAVSPLQERTIGIDETLHLHSSAKKQHVEEVAGEKEHSIPGAFPEDDMAPPIRTSKTYSKSAQLSPTSASFTVDNTTNRFSFPPDLSQLGDSSMNTTSDAMTDIAVRFSMPQNTATVGKPHIIDVPLNKTPTTVDSLPLKPARYVRDDKRHRPTRSSVAFEDEIAPLAIKKRLEGHRAARSYTETPWDQRKAPSRCPSPIDEGSEPSRSSFDSTSNLRLSGINFIRKVNNTHLPGLKEEPLEDESMSSRQRVAANSNSFQFPLPARIAAVKAMQERRLQENDRIQQGTKYSEARRRGQTLAQTRDLPSLNFSQMDLFDKLNDALEVRPSKSLDIVRRSDFSGIYCPSPQRPMSTDTLRERYTSFFNKPEEIDSVLGSQDGEDDEEKLLTQDSAPNNEACEVDASKENLEPSEEQLSDEASSNRALSPQEFLSVASQVNRLSIPSVSALTDRLSELLHGNFKLDTHMVGSDEEVKHTIDDIHQLGHDRKGPRPETVLSNRTSAGFRTLAERAEEFLKHGHHDSTVPKGTAGLDKALPPLPESQSADRGVSPVNSTDDKTSHLSGSVSAPSELGGLPARPATALTRNKSPATAEEVLQLLPPEGNPLIRNAKRSLVVSSPSSRPWNLDENYPWAATNLAIDLSVPVKAHQRESAISEVMRERGTKSLDLTNTTGDITGLMSSSGIDIGSLTTDLDSNASVTTEQLTGVPEHERTETKHTIIGSISKKIGFARCNEESTMKSLAETLGHRERPHSPGERYPSTGLTPPTALNLDEVRSFFSDDSSDEQRKAPGRKRRLTGLKTPKLGNKARPGNSHAQSLDVLRPHEYDAGSMNQEARIGAGSSAHTYDGFGMGKAEFRFKRFGEKLRHL